MSNYPEPYLSQQKRAKNKIPEHYFLSISYDDNSQTIWPNPIPIDSLTQCLLDFFETPNCKNIKKIIITPENERTDR